jgi:hypothetical protein
MITRSGEIKLLGSRGRPLRRLTALAPSIQRGILNTSQPSRPPGLFGDSFAFAFAAMSHLLPDRQSQERRSPWTMPTRDKRLLLSSRTYSQAVQMSTPSIPTIEYRRFGEACRFHSEVENRPHEIGVQGNSSPEAGRYASHCTWGG